MLFSFLIIPVLADPTPTGIHCLIGTESMNIQKGGNFLVTGSGNVTFTINYSLAANRSVDASSLPYPFIETGGVVESDLLLYIPYVNTLDYSQHFMFIPTVEGSVS